MVRYLFYTIGDLTYQSPLVIWNFVLALMCSRVLRVGSHVGDHTKYLTPNVIATKSILK